MRNNINTNYNISDVDDKFVYIVSSIIILITIAYTLYINNFNGSVDFILHSEFMDEQQKNPSLYLYSIIYSVGNLIRHYTNLSSSYVIFYMVASAIFIKFFSISLFFYNNNFSKTVWLAATTLIYMPIYNIVTETFYMGQIPPNSAHNTTTIISSAFYVISFLFVYRFCNNLKILDIIFSSVFLALSISIKASAYPFLLIGFTYALAFKFNLRKLYGFIFIALTTLPIFYLYTQVLAPEKFELIYEPLKVWNYYSNNNISLAILCSFLFLISCFFIKNIFKDEIFVSILISLCCSILFLSLFSEVGPRKFHFNLIWGSIIIYNIMLVYLVKIVFIEQRGGVIIKFLYYSHVISGFIYIIARSGQLW